MADGQHITSFDGVTCAPNALGDLFQVKRETIARMSSVEGMPKVKQGMYPVRDCVVWFIDRLRESSAGNTPEDKKARIKVAQQQELRLKIENAERLGELVSSDLVGSGFAAMASSLATELDALGPRMAAEIAAIDDPAKCQQVIFDECRRIRDTAAAAFEAVAGDIDSRRDTAPAAEPERGAVGRSQQDTAAVEP